jgi:carbonic anhydrase
MQTSLLSFGFCLICMSLVLGAESPASPVEPDAAVAKLQAGNKRFVENADSSSKPTSSRRLATAQAQHPFAIIVGCSDSRTPPEMIFDQNIGDLFVVRTAGNLADDFALGSIEYAVEHLGARLIVVLGHSRCGAVLAAVESASAPGHVGAIVRDIRPSVEAVQAEGGDVLANAIRSNINRVAKRINEKAELGPLASSVRVVEAYYDLDTGKVIWLKEGTTSR